MRPKLFGTSFFAQALLPFCFILAASVMTSAQSAAARPDRGITPVGPYHVSDVEAVNTTNGNVHVSIPLAKSPAIAGGKLAAVIRATYDSKLWDARTEERRQFLNEPIYTARVPQLSENGGWKIGGRYTITAHLASADYDPIPIDGDPDFSYSWSKVILSTPDGATHELRPLDYAGYSGNHEYFNGFYNIPNTGSAIRYYSFDGSFLFAKLYPHTSSTWWELYLPDGTKVVELSSGIQRIIDTNNNSIKIYSDIDNGLTTTHYQDEQTGREIKIAYNPSGNNNQGSAQVLYQTVGGDWAAIDINFGTTTVSGKVYDIQGPYCSFQEALVPTEMQVVREIILPQTEPGVQRQKFTFAYNSDTSDSRTVYYQPSYSCGSPQVLTNSPSHGWGSISQMTMPQGAVVNYTYTLDGADSIEEDAGAAETVSAKAITHDGTTDVWSYTIGSSSGSVTSPDGSVTTESFYFHSPGYSFVLGGSNGLAGLVYRTNQSNRILTERHWVRMKFDGASENAPGALLVINPVVDAEYTTLLDGSGNALKMTAKTYQFDYNGNVIGETDYDWFDPEAVSRDSNGVPTGVPSGATALRTTSTSYYNAASSSSSENIYAKRSLTYATPLILNALQETTTGPAIAQFSYDGNSYGTPPTIGNLTSKSVWDDVASDWITVSTTYNSSGNVTSTTDARIKVTNFYYDDSPYVMPNRVEVNPQNGTGTQTVTTVFDFYTGLVTSQTDPNGKTSTIDYTNQLLNEVDPFGRPGITKSPAVTVNGSSQQELVTTTYEDHLRRVTVATDLYAEDDKLLKTRTTTDMLGWPILSEQTEDGTNYTIFSKKAYDSVNRISYSSSPMRCTVQSGTDCSSNPLQYVVTAATNGWTRVTNDVLGRPIEVASFAGATQPPATGTTSVTGFTGTVTTAYDANFTTVTDQVGKQRRSKVDGLGRLVRVDEPDSSGNLGTTSSPNQDTLYDYDVFDNLLHVYQGSQQTRTFTYDSLSRLRTTANPESGTITYVYDDNGNLVVKKDARDVSAHYEYDALNRVTRRWYNGSSALSATTHNSPALPSGVGASSEVTYAYDSGSITNGKGRLASVSSSVSALVYGDYNAVGRASGGTQTIYSQAGNQDYVLSYTYDLSGHVTSLTYPSGRSVSYNYDNAGRLADKDSTHLAFTGNLGESPTSSRTYAKGISYGSMGQMTQEQFGTTTAVYNKLFHNSRGQLTEVLASTSGNDTTFNRGKIVNDYGTTNNNGNLLKQTVYIPDSDTNNNPTSWYQQYDYDNLNRLSRVREFNSGNTQLWKQTYVYDRYGNRTIDYDNTTSGIPRPQFTVSTSNNRLGVPGGQSGTMTYDNAGNLTTDTYSAAAVTRAYDAENRMTQEIQANSYVAGVYSYDGNGRRVKRNVGGVETWQVYGLGGELLAEYAANTDDSRPLKEYGYRNGQLLVTATITGAGWGSAPSFADNPLNPNGAGTVIKLAHLTELRTAVNQLRTHAGLSNFDFTVDANPTQYVTTVKADHVRELRTALEQALTALHLPAGSYAHPTLTEQSSVIYAVDFQELRDQIIAAWGNVTINWLVTDQLGTPRIIFDQTGSLANVSRHDYLPFGEELTTQGLRESVPGYTNIDGARQKFTLKERDNETNLDYFIHRYYSASQGRFTSVDPLMRSASIEDPQSFNRYSYIENNPLNDTDPDGLCPKGKKCYYEKDEKGKNVEYYDDEEGNPVLVTDIGARKIKASPMVAGPVVAAPPDFEIVYRSRISLTPKPAPTAITTRGRIFSLFGRLFGIFSIIHFSGPSSGCGASRGGCPNDPPTMSDEPDTSANPDPEDNKPSTDLEPTPETSPKDFEPVRGTPAKRNRTTKEIWEKDRLHKDHYEVYKNKKRYDQGRRTRTVWSDGRPKL